MRRINILFSDPDIPSYAIGEIICERFNLGYFVFGDELRQRLLSEKSNFMKEIKSFLDSGNVIPTSISCQFVKNSLKELKANNVLLNGFPRTLEQFNFLINYLKEENIQLDQIWYIKPLKSIAVENHQAYYLSRREEINTIHDSVNEIEWKVLEIDRSECKNKQVIIEKINAIA